MKKLLQRASLLFSVLLSAFLLTACTAGEYVPHEGSQGLSVHFIDVGQADAALVMCDGEAMLIDGGNVDDSSTVAAYLKKQNISHLDYVVSTHGHEDHVGGLAGALNVCSAGTVLASCETYDSKAYESFVKYAEKRGAPLTVPKAGDTFNIGSAKITVLGPIYKYDEENDNSIVLRIGYGKTSFLFTGDMEEQAEKDLVNGDALLNADVLKVGHHGSNTSSSYVFLRQVMPKYAIISAGENNTYGHPHEEVLSRLRDVGAKLYRTDLQGDIIAFSDGESVTFETSKNSAKEVNPTVSEKTSEKTYYIGNKKSKKFHSADCKSLPKAENSVEFTNRTDALSAGYTPCGNCEP